MTYTENRAWNVQIWVGLKENYKDDCTTLKALPYVKTHSIKEVERICQKFVDKEKDCVTVTPTKFIYTGGKEEGAIIGFIQYPRFQKHSKEITDRAVKLAEQLMKELNQCRVTVTTPEWSIMISR